MLIMEINQANASLDRGLVVHMDNRIRGLDQGIIEEEEGTS